MRVLVVYGQDAKPVDPSAVREWLDDQQLRSNGEGKKENLRVLNLRDVLSTIYLSSET